jgi:hypothetical protein
VSAEEQAKADMLIAEQASTENPIKEALKKITKTTTKNEEPMKTATTTTTPKNASKVTPTPAPTPTPLPVAKKPNPRAVVPNADEDKHYGIVIGDVCTFVGATDKSEITGQVYATRIYPVNGRSTTKLIIFDAEGKATSKKTEVYTTRLTKVKTTPKKVAKVKVKAEVKA